MPPARNSDSVGRLWLPLLIVLCPLGPGPVFGPSACRVVADDKSDATPQPDPEYIRKMIPEKIAGEYRHGRLIPLEVEKRQAYVIEPTGTVDPARRWIWIFPFWLGINDGHGVLHHRWYVEQYLERGFHVAGINVGTSCGSPRAAAVCQQFYEVVRERFKLHSRARLLVQSNGGLIGYGWAFRNPDCVERVGGICPATDFRTWPGLHNVINFPEKGLDYDLTQEQLAANIASYNPIAHVEELALNHVKVLHIHGDADELVPMEENSTALVRRYRQFGGEARVEVLAGVGHGGKVLYESQPLLDFLLEDCESLDLGDVATADTLLLRWEIWQSNAQGAEGARPVDQLVQTVEMLIDPSKPFFGRVKAGVQKFELRGYPLLKDVTTPLKLRITTTVDLGDQGTTSSQAETIALGETLTREADEFCEFRITLTRPCLPKTP